MDVPKYLLTKRFLIQTVVFIALFSVLFMLVYRPSASTSWFGFSPIGLAAATLGYYFGSIFVLIASKLVLYRYQLVHTPTVLLYVLWMVGEIVVISVLYVVFALWVVPEPQAFSMRLVLSAALGVPPVLVIPYAIMVLWATNRAGKEEFEMLRLSYRAAMRGQDPQMLHLRDSKGDLKMSVRSSAIYYIEAQDNYVQIFYDMDGEMCSYLLRCSTQKLEAMLGGTALVRCHRSYIANLDHVMMLRNEREGSFLVLDCPSSRQVPVSKTYYKQTLSLLEERNLLQNS